MTLIKFVILRTENDCNENVKKFSHKDMCSIHRNFFIQCVRLLFSSTVFKSENGIKFVHFIAFGQIFRFEVVKNEIPIK